MRWLEFPSFFFSSSLFRRAPVGRYSHCWLHYTRAPHPISMACTGQCKKSREERKVPDEDIEDVWGSDEENISTHADLKRAHVNSGYLDGLTQAQESSLQAGFDNGFPTGADLGKRVGRILALALGSPDLARARTELNIAKVLDQKFFSDELEAQSHPLIEEWEASMRGEPESGSGKQHNEPAPQTETSEPGN